MTCNICKGKGYYYINDYNPEGHQRLFFHCPSCEAGKKYADMDLCDDLTVTVKNNYRVSWEERTERNDPL